MRSVPEPPLATRTHDPAAVAVANASLLGVGYLMLRRPRLAVVTGAVTVALVLTLAVISRSVWLEIAVLLWWAALVVHGWFLAGGRTPWVAVRGHWGVAFGFAAPVLLAVALLRFDAALIGQGVAEARDNGDCARALGALDGVGVGHRVVDAPLTARGDETVKACQRLQVAEDHFRTALTGDTEALEEGFDVLAEVLVDQPGHDRMVVTVLDRFLGRLPTDDPCRTATLTDWLRERQASHDALDRSAETVARTAPAALVGCGDAKLAEEEWQAALARYQQLLDQYPGNSHTAKAQQGVHKATLAIELENVRSLLESPGFGEPDYCSRPAKYSGAAPYRKGANRALFYGTDTYSSRLPKGWRATDVTNAVLVVCVGDDKMGAAVRTCYYENKRSPYFPHRVTFHKIAIPVRAYELRTGKLVAKRTLVVEGRSCPNVLRYKVPAWGIDAGPPGDVYVEPTDSQVHAAFRSLIHR